MAQIPMECLHCRNRLNRAQMIDPAQEIVPPINSESMMERGLTLRASAT